MDEERCPAIVRNKLAVHISFNEKILQFALENWPDEDAMYRRQNKSGPFQYNDNVYQNLGL